MANYKLLSILFIIPFLFCIAYAHDDEGHVCMHAQMQGKPEEVDVESFNFDEDQDSDSPRMLSSYPGIRIATNWQHLSGSSSFQSYVKYDLLPPIVSYFQNALRIKRPLTRNIRSTSNNLCGYSAPSVLKSSGVSADHFYFFTANRDSSNYVATASYCTVDTNTGRPYISLVRLNQNYLLVARGDDLVHEKNINMVMHEMIHTLGFSGDLFPSFISSSGRRLSGHIRRVNLNGNSRTVLDVPVLTNRVRQHFGCSSLPGAYLENNGDSDMTAGSHFERRHFLVDVMTSGLLNSQRITEMTLAVLEASGWYVPNYNYAEPNPFGKGQGCGFVNNRCSVANSDFAEFCSTQQRRGCFITGRGGGFCKTDPLSDGCMYHSPTVNFDCMNPKAASQTRLSNIQVFGNNANSKCFDGTLSTQSNDKPGSFCFRATCSGSGSGTRLTIQVGNRNVVCNREGTVSVSGYKGTLNCPDPLSYCQTTGRAYCKKNCMGRGQCSNGRCICNRGFTGSDCSERT